MDRKACRQNFGNYRSRIERLWVLLCKHDDAEVIRVLRWREWCRSVQAGRYNRERLGAGDRPLSDLKSDHRTEP